MIIIKANLLLETCFLYFRHYDHIISFKPVKNWWGCTDPFMGETEFPLSQKVMINNLPKMPIKGSALGFKLRLVWFQCPFL